jgi:hypothetical protein
MTEQNEPGLVGLDRYCVSEGTRIWRPVVFRAPENVQMADAARAGTLIKELDAFELADLTDRRTYMMRANHAQFHRDPKALWAYAPTCLHKGKRVQRLGMILFLKEPVPSDWTWIVVTSVARTGNAIFGNPESGDQQILLDQYEYSEKG